MQKAEEDDDDASDGDPSKARRKPLPKGAGKTTQKGRGRPPTKNLIKNAPPKTKMNKLEIDMDIEAEDEIQTAIDREALIVARNRFPRIFELSDERAALKFKSNHWLRKQVAKKQNNRA